MGLLKHLLFWPVTGPQFLTEFSIEKVNEVVREQLTDDQPIKEELLELQLQLEAGEIDDDEYVERETRLMQALRDVRHWREQFGMGISGGPVRVAETPQEAESTPSPSEDAREPEVMSRDAKVDIELDWDER